MLSSAREGDKFWQLSLPRKVAKEISLRRVKSGQAGSGLLEGETSKRFDDGIA